MRSRDIENLGKQRVTVSFDGGYIVFEAPFYLSDERLLQMAEYRLHNLALAKMKNVTVTRETAYDHF